MPARRPLPALSEKTQFLTIFNISLSQLAGKVK
jgi:hypothetical protein